MIGYIKHYPRTPSHRPHGKDWYISNTLQFVCESDDTCVLYLHPDGQWRLSMRDSDQWAYYAMPADAIDVCQTYGVTIGNMKDRRFVPVLPTASEKE